MIDYITLKLISHYGKEFGAQKKQNANNATGDSTIKSSFKFDVFPRKATWSTSDSHVR